MYPHQDEADNAIERLADGFQLVFERPRNRALLQYEMDRSVDLRSWAALDVSLEVTAIDERTERTPSRWPQAISCVSWPSRVLLIKNMDQ